VVEPELLEAELVELELLELDPDVPRETPLEPLLLAAPVVPVDPGDPDDDVLLLPEPEVEPLEVEPDEAPLELELELVVGIPTTQA
jgi:hypothetical protein